MDLQSQFSQRERRIMEITYCPHGQASISDVLKEAKPSPSSRWIAAIAGLAAMISVAVALALPLGEKSQGLAAANAATPSTSSGQAPNGAGTQPAGQPAAVSREQAVKAVVAELNARCPAGWDRPAIVETGQVQPFGWPKGKGWHVRTKRTGLAISDKTLDGRLDVWLMEDSFAQVGPVDLGKKQLTPLTTASECTVWPLDRAFFRGGGGSDWPSWESDIVYALGTSTPEGKLRRQRVDRAEKLLAGKGLPCGLNLYNRGTGPYLEVTEPQGRWGFSVFPFPLDAAGRKTIITHATTGPEQVLAAGRQYTLLGDAYSASTRGQEACAAIAQALDLAPVTENVIAAARAQDVKDRIDSIWLVLSRYGNDGKSETLVLSSMTYSSATKVARQQALDMIERLYEEGFFSNCYSGSYGVPAPNVPQVVINVDSRNEHSVTRCDWQSRMGWNSDTWAALKSLRGTLDGAAAARMDKFLAGFADLPAHWQKEHDAIAALPKEVRAAVDAVAQDRFPQITWYMRPPPTAQVYGGVAEEFRISPSLEQAYRQLAKGRPASLKAIGELTKAKAVWCLASALCSEDVEVACQAAFALAELKDARPAAFVIQVARAYGAIPSERNRWSSELDNRPERMQYALATALDAMLGTSVKIKVVGEQTKWVADHEGFVKALDIWQQALDQRQQNRPASRSAPSTASALSASSGQATQPAEDKKLPGSKYSDLRPVVRELELIAVMEALEEPRTEELENGLRAVSAQEFAVLEVLGDSKPDGATCRLTYQYRTPDEAPIAKGQCVIWLFGHSFDTGIRPSRTVYWGRKAMADSKDNRTALSDLIRAKARDGSAPWPQEKPVLLAGSRVPLSHALGMHPRLIAVCRALETGFGVTDEAGVENCFQRFQVVQLLDGRGPANEVTILYTLFHIPTCGFCERRIEKGDTVLWFAQPGDKSDQWKGIKAMLDTPANRALVVSAGKAAGIAPAPTTAPSASTSSGQATQPATHSVRQATWAAVGGESRDYQKLAGPEMEIFGLVGGGGTYPAGRPEKTSWRYSVTVDHPWIAGDSRQVQEAHDVLDRLRGQREPTQFNRTPLLVKGKITPDPFAGNRPKLVVGWVRELGPDDKDWDSTCPMNLQLLPRPDDGEIALVAACQAAGPAESQLGYSGVRHARQKFKLVEVFHGDAKAGQVLDLRYSYLAPDMGFGWSGRDIRPDEKVIWVVRKVDGRLGGYGTVPDTQNNRKAALMLAERLRAAAAASSATQPASARPAGTATAPTTAPATQPTAAQQAEIERLVGELGGDKFAQRLAAQEALLKIGLPALAALRKASGDANTERADRAKLLVKQIQDQAERELIDGLVRAIKRDLPADWSVVQVRHGEVTPTHRPASQGWEIRTLRNGYKSEDMKRGIWVEGRLWIMDRDYVAGAQPDVPARAASTSPARELPPWHGRRVFESGETYAAKALQETRTVDDVRKQWAALIARYTSKDERYWNDSIRELDQWTDDRIIPEMVADFRNKNVDAHLRRSTLRILARMDDRKVIPIMLDAPKDSDAQVRSYAVACLGRRGGPEAFGVIEAALKDADGNVRHTAMVAMGVLRDNRSLDVLLKLLEDPNDLTRRFVAEGLGELGDRRARPNLAASMKDKSELVRRFAVLALARLGDPMVLDRLLTALKTDVDGLRGWAPWALGQLGDKRAVEPLIAAMKDQDVNMRAAAIRALGKLNDRRAVEPLLAALKDADSTIRRYAAESLGQLGEPRAVEALKPLLSDNNDSVRAAASNALKKLQQAAPKRPATRPAPSTSSGQAARAGQTRPPEQKGRERAAADIKAGTPRILYYGKPWSLGKPLVDEASRLPVELVAGCDVMPEFVAETDAYNAAMRQWAKSRPAGAAPAAPSTRSGQASSGATTRPVGATQTAQAPLAATAAHGDKIVIPLDFQREAVLLPRMAALAAMHWDAAKLEDNCRTELAAQPKEGADPNRIAFGACYTNRAAPVPLSDLAEVRVRPITFVAQQELKDLAARLAGNDPRAAEASLPELYRLGGRARNIVPMLLPHIKAGKSYGEVLTVVHGLGVLGPHAAEAVPTLAEKFRTAEDLDKSWYALALGRVGAPAVATLERLLRQESDEIARRAAARGLARGDAAGRKALRAALSDPNAEVRAAAVAVLPDDSDRETRDLVVRLLADPAAGVRQAAAGKASLCEPALKGQAVAALLGMLSEADERSQICALYGLGALGSRPEIVVPRLKPFLKTRGESSGETRGAALSAVARFGPAAADLAPEVIACMDGDETQTVAALRALEAIGGKPAGAAAARVVALARSKNWLIADAAISALFAMESDSSAHAARVVSLLSDQQVDTRQRLAGQALAAMGPAAKDALPVLASGLVSIGSAGFVPAEKVRWMAAIDAEGAVAAIENDQRAQPRRGDGFRVQDQRPGSLIILQRLKAHAAAVAQQARQEGRRRPTREFECLRSRDWPRVVRAGDRIERVIALLGTPDSVGGGMLTYDALPGKDSSCRPRKIVVSVEHGKATAVREEAPIAAKMVPAGEEGRPGSNARELLSGVTTQPASQPASPL